MQFNLLDTGTRAVLYQSDANAAGQDWAGFLVPAALLPGGSTANAPATVSVASSWNDYPGVPIQGQSGGSYVFFAAAPAAGSADLLMTLVANVNAQWSRGYRYLLWAAAGAASAVSAIPFASPGGAGSVQQLGVVQMRNLGLSVPAGVSVTLDTGAATFTLATGGSLAFTLTDTVDTPVTVGSGIGALTLPLTGTSCGGVSFALTLSAPGGAIANDFATLQVGVKYFYTSGVQTLAQLYPVLNASLGAQQFPFTAVLDPLNPTDPGRTRFTFSGTAPPAFSTGLRTDAGVALTLTPVTGSAGFALAADRTTSALHGNQQVDTYYATLAGGFTVGAPAGAPAAPLHLLCGLAAVEAVSVYPAGGGYGGDVLTFRPVQPAHATVFPVRPVDLSTGSSAGGPAPLLDSAFTTSWVTVGPGTGDARPTPNQYYTQSTGASLFGGAPVIAAVPELLGLFQTPSATLGATTPVFPLAAYGGLVPATGPDAFARGQAGPFETQILNPSRHAWISAAATLRPALAPRLGLWAAVDAGGVVTTTPQGLLATVAANGSWSSLLLAQNTPAGGLLEQLQFLDVAPLLQSAFETNQQFLVITRWPPAVPGSWPTTFADAIEIEGWPFVLDLGQGSSFGSYGNVLICKFCSGTLKERAANPLLWTHPADFNDAASNGLTAVSSWLQAYIAAAEQRPRGQGYDYFVQVVNDSSWNGILALQVDLDLETLPPEIQALVAGIDLSLFKAHHFGVEVNPVTSPTGGALEINGNSSLFGLIDYQDPTYAAAVAAGANANWPVPATPGTYDFKVLLLRVLFENTEIRDFQSKAQVTLNAWFGDPVAKLVVGAGGNISNSIVLDGALQSHDGTDTYVFASNADTIFLLNSNVLAGVEVTSAQFNTLQSAGQGSTLEVSRFSFSGYLEFGVVTGFDAFSFGGAAPASAGAGLAFSNLFLEMSFDLNTPSDVTYAFDADQVAFNVARSTSRPGSLFPGFPLKLAGFVQGTGANPPSRQGYLPVQVQNSSFGALDPLAAWYGLQMTLDLGTPGALASAAGWQASLLLAWSTGSKAGGASYRAWIGIQLPGASGNGKLLSLQGILKLAIGSIQFLYVAESQAYLLKLTQIALKFLSFSFPPSGNTIVFLFGDPAGGGAGSLGWYAAYNNPSAPRGEPAALSAPEEALAALPASTSRS